MDYATIQNLPAPLYTATTLREPKSRIISLYKYWRSTDDKSSIKNKWFGPLVAKLLDFPDFLQHFADDIQLNINNVMVRNYLGHCWSDESGNLVIEPSSAIDIAINNLSKFDLIGDVRDLSKFMRKMADDMEINVPSEIPKDNITPPQDVDLSLDTQIVQDLLEHLRNV